MVRNKKTKLAILISLMFALTVFFAVLTSPVLADSGKGDSDKVDKIKLNEEILKEAEENGAAEPEEGTWVHQDPNTFRKNFCLTPEQKEYSIKAIEDIVSNVLEPEMSDLEKYYRLAVWQNMHVSYDSEFWDGKYEFEFYRHQWDAYGVLTDESVCAGMATFYANLCHAADLPCKFARLKEGCVDHTISYIPDINGNAYYADVTENDFLMGPNGGFVEYVDTGFSDIEKDPTESTFEYVDDDGYMRAANLRECYEEKRKNWSTGEFKVTYEEWFDEYALHNSPEKTFLDEYEYVEKGSGLPSTDVDYHHASYKDFDAYSPQPYEGVRTKGATGIWFLDDFYEEPVDVKAMIEGKKFDKQLLDISGVEGNYDGCTSAEALVKAVKNNISIRYFPTYKNGKVVAEGANLTCDTHYTVTCSDFDANNEAVITITGKGGYSGTYQFSVSLDTAVVKKAPTRINGLVYNGSSQALIKPGKATNGTMVYAACEANASEPADKAYKEAIPTGTKAGKYDVWYKVRGDEGYGDSKAQRLGKAVEIAPMASEILAEDVMVKVGETFQLNPALNTGRPATYDYFSYDDNIATVSDDGVVTGVKEGIIGLVIFGKLSDSNTNYAEPEVVMISVEVIAKEGQQQEVIRAANPMTLKGKTTKIKRSKLRKKAQTIDSTKVIEVSNAQGDLAYKLVSAKKGKKNFKKKFKIDAMTGKVTAKKGLRKGTYKVKVQVKAAGNANYEASDWKDVTFKVRVK